MLLSLAPMCMLRGASSPVTVHDDAAQVDIDHPSTEEPLTRQLLGDDAVAALIDELYFEHHVKRHPLGRTHFGWAHSVSETNCNITDSYEVFARLREKGIRAHSWV